jgi:hypothetical protein
MYRTWLTGATGVITLVLSVVLMAHTAPATHQPSHAHVVTTRSATKP